jgi:CMP-N-acetylneuraminic acid synthetase
MRHESERVPGKNYRELAGRPLYSHILVALSSCPEIERIVVDTDSPTVRDGVRAEFPGVLLLERPEHLRDGQVPMNDVLLHDAGQVEAPYYLQTHSTNPLLRAETISRAIALYFEAYPRHDSLFSVTRLQQRLWDADVRPVNHDPRLLIRTQDLPPVYLENSCLYLFERERFLVSGNRIGQSPMLFEIGAEEALDIDDEVDFRLAECLLANAADREG